LSVPQGGDVQRQVSAAGENEGGAHTGHAHFEPFLMRFL
jgi:hypothetical protein